MFKKNVETYNPTNRRLFISFISIILLVIYSNNTYAANQAPSFSANITNNTAPIINQDVQFNITWSVTSGTLSQCIFSWDNGTGVFVNDTTISLSGTSAVCSSNKTIQTTKGTIMQWQFFGLAVGSAWNQTPTYSVNVSPGFIISSFNDGLTSSNITFSTSVLSITKLINLSADANVTSFLIDLTGFQLNDTGSGVDSSSTSNGTCSFGGGDATAESNLTYNLPTGFGSVYSNLSGIWINLFGFIGGHTCKDYVLRIYNFSSGTYCNISSQDSPSSGCIGFETNVNKSVATNCGGLSGLYNSSNQISIYTCVEGASNNNAVFFNLSSYPQNLTILQNTTQVFQNLSNFNGSLTSVNLNGTATNQILRTNCLLGYCSIGVIFNSSMPSILQYSNINLLWNDIFAPTLTSNITNISSTRINQDVQFNITLLEGVNLSSYIFSWNDSGSFQNFTYKLDGDTFDNDFSSWTSYTQGLSNSASATTGGILNFNISCGQDVAGAYLNFSYNITYIKFDVRKNSGVTGWEVRLQNYKGDILNHLANLANGDRSTLETYVVPSSTLINISINSTGTVDICGSPKMNVIIDNISVVPPLTNVVNHTITEIRTITTAGGNSVGWTFYSNDSSNNWNQSNTFSFIVSNTPSTFTSNNTNNTAPQQNQTSQFNITITDPDTIAGFIFAWDNGTGTFVNDSFRALSLTNTTVSVNKTIQRTFGTNMSWIWYANDSAGNWNNTGINSFSVSGTNPTPTTPVLSVPSSNTYRNLSWINFSFSSTDADGETITYTIYADTNSNPITFITNTTNQYFNWTNLNQSIYYWKVIANDPGGTSANSSIFNFTVDTTLPNITVVFPSNGSSQTSKTINLNITSVDTNLDACWFNTTLQGSGNLEGSSNRTLSCNTNTSFTVDLFSDYIVNIFALDLAGNINLTKLYITTSSGGSSSSGGGGGGGSTETTPAPQQPTTLCGNHKCEELENPQNCAIDCPVNIDSLLNGELLNTAWFAKFIIYSFLGLSLFIFLRRQLIIEDRR